MLQTARAPTDRRHRFSWFLTVALMLLTNPGCLAGEEKILLSAEPSTHEVEVSEELRVKALAPEVASAKPLVLHIGGVEVPSGKSAIVRVYANLPEADAATGVDSDHYLGYFTVVAKTLDEGVAAEPRDIVIEVSWALPALLGEGSPLQVTLVPVAGKEGDQVPEAFEMTIVKILLREEG